MILRSDFTLEELKTDTDPLSYVCHSVAKLKMIANVIQTNCIYANRPPLEVFETDDIRSMGELIEDAAIEIETLVGVAEDQDHEMFHENKRLKIFKARPIFMDTPETPGTVIRGFPDELRVVAGEGVLSIMEIQGSSGKRLLIKDFLRGYPLTPGTILH